MTAARNGPDRGGGAASVRDEPCVRRPEQPDHPTRLPGRLPSRLILGVARAIVDFGHMFWNTQLIDLIEVSGVPRTLHFGRLPPHGVPATARLSHMPQRIVSTSGTGIVARYDIDYDTNLCPLGARPSHRAEILPRPLRPLLKRTLRAAAIFICHALLACVVVACVFGVEQFIRVLGEHFEPGHELELFNRLPLSYLFDAIDFVLIVLFGVSGSIEAGRELFGSDEHDT
jgi:hypothetical protein